MNPNFLEFLPVELIQEIIINITDLNSLLRLNQVNKLANNLSLDHERFSQWIKFNQPEFFKLYQDYYITHLNLTPVACLIKIKEHIKSGYAAIREEMGFVHFFR